MDGSTVQVVAIVAICGFVGFAVKSASGGNTKVTKWIPVIVGVLGGMLGVIYRAISADFAQMDILSAIASGIASGLASTGVHQAMKQSGSNTDTADKEE